MSTRQGPKKKQVLHLEFGDVVNAVFAVIGEGVAGLAQEELVKHRVGFADLVQGTYSRLATFSVT